jgi:hypothetical protein
MGQTTLVREQVDGGTKLLARLRDRGFGATAACWAKTEDDGQLYLYIVRPGVELTGVRPGYGEIYDAIKEMEGSWTHVFERINSNDIKLIDSNHPLARGVLDLYTRYPQLLPLWEGRYNLGGVFVEGLFVYPPALFQSQPQPQAG